MTEKRYVSDVKNTEKEVRIFDLEAEKKIFNIFFNELDSAICLNGALTDTVDLLNELNNENTMLKEEIKDFQDLLASKEEVYLKPIIHQIEEAYETERTQIGKNCLKQLLEQLE